MTETGPVRIVVADDHQVVRDGFAELLNTQPDFTVIATASDGATAVRVCRELRPDIVLMDVRMPGMDGIEATRQLTATSADAPRVLVLTTFDLDQYVYEALAAGASGFLLKDGTAERLFDAVRVIAAWRRAPCPRRHPPADRRIRRAAAGDAAAAASPRLAHQARNRSAATRRRGSLEPRDRQPPRGQRRDRQDPRQSPAQQARPARSDPSGNCRLRVRPHQTPKPNPQNMTADLRTSTRAGRADCCQRSTFCVDRQTERNEP